MAARRAVNPSRRVADSGSIPLVNTLHQKSRTSPLLSVGLILLGAILLIVYSYHGSGGSTSEKLALSKASGVSCMSDVLQAIPVLKQIYGGSMRKVLHVGPDTCMVVSMLLKQEDTEAWGVEPYDLEDADTSCKGLVRRGFVRSADIKFPLPYRPKSFSLVVVSDALDYLSPKYLNKTLPELARASSDGLVIFTGSPGQERGKGSELSKFGKPAKMRSSTWWMKYFLQTGLQENDAAMKKYEQAATQQQKKKKSSVMEGLIPNVYKIVTRYKKGQATPSVGSMFLNEMPPASYAHLTPSESAKYLMSDRGLYPNSPRSLMSALPPPSGAPDAANSSAPPKSRGLQNAKPTGRKRATPRRRNRMG